MYFTEFTSLPYYKNFKVNAPTLRKLLSQLSQYPITEDTEVIISCITSLGIESTGFSFRLNYYGWQVKTRDEGWRFVTPQQMELILDF